jgi:hypothetical protein
MTVQETSQSARRAARSPGYRSCTLAEDPESPQAQGMQGDRPSGKQPDKGPAGGPGKGPERGPEKGPERFPEKGPEKPDRPDRKPPVASRRASTPDQLALFGGDRYAAIAGDRRIRFFHYDELPDAGAARPFAQIELPAPVLRLASRPRDRRAALIVALADRSLMEVEIPDVDARRDRDTKPRARVLVKDLGGDLRHIVGTRRRMLAVVDERPGRTVLVEIDATSSSGGRRGELPLGSITSVSALDRDRSDLLLVVDARHGAHVVGFAANLDATTLQVTPIGADVRATAAIALSDRSIVVARKGGEVVQMRYDSSVGGRADAAAELCRRLRAVLRACGCNCHRHAPRKACCDCCDDAAHPGGGRPGGGRPGSGYPGSGYPGGGRPGGGDPGGGHPGGVDPGRPGGGDPGRPDGGPGGVVDDEPCGEKQRANLTWSVAQLVSVGHHIVAIARGNERMAVLDRNLNVVFERYLGARGSLVATSGGASDRMLVMQRGKARLESWEVDTYARSARAIGVLPSLGRRLVDPAQARTVTYRGRKARPATPNPQLKIAVFTILEPGQPFGDPDQAKMQALLEPNVYDIAYDYYRENSFEIVETQFTVFGVHIGGTRKPLVLPQSFASYFYDDFSPGGIEATMPGDWSNPLVLDGTEAMTLRSDPAAGVGKDYPIEFAALWTSRTHNAYPVAVNFAATETLQIDVEDQTGTARTLNLTFGALSLSLAQGDDEAAFLSALGDHVTDAIRAAESAAGAPEVIQDVVFRRIRLSTDDAEFGRLQGQYRIDPSGGATQKGTIAITPPGAPPAPLVAIGLNGSGETSGVLGGVTEIVEYFAECIHASRFDAGEGLGLNDAHLDTVVDAEEDAAAQEVRVQIRLTTEKGGTGAEITLVSSSGLADSGWSTATTVSASESNANNQNTMRYASDLSDHVFTAAMDHIRDTGPWDPEAVRAQFAEFDAMMIGFVGVCPTSVPVGDRWSSSDAVDFDRLRMFVRNHQATDLNNPNPGDPPVTMGVDLLIGQRFNQFDPGVMSHEIGHALGLPDLYYASGYRDDVVYIDDWCQMGGGNSNFNHFCAWSKWSVGWIVDDPGDPSINQVVEVPMPDPSDTVETEAWLYPVEYWDSSIRADVEAEVGSSLPIGQMMKVHLGSDGGIIDIIELRAQGVNYSQVLPPTPAVIVTNVLDPETDRRWAVNGLYRRSVHLLNEGDELRSVGDVFNFAASPEFPVKGTTVELIDLQTIRGGSIPIARVRVVREPAEYIDLYFEDNVPSYKSPDIWVDWPADNADPSEPHIYPEGTPTDQGEVVRFPSSGVEPHFLVVRPHNAGSVHAEDVKVRWFICDPPGAGDDGKWVQRDTMTLAQIDGDTSGIAAFTWNVDSSTNAHQCLRAEIIDWTIPAEVDPATGDTLALASDDVILQNNIAQKNVFDFEAAT